MCKGGSLYAHGITDDVLDSNHDIATIGLHDNNNDDYELLLSLRSDGTVRAKVTNTIEDNFNENADGPWEHYTMMYEYIDKSGFDLLISCDEDAVRSYFNGQEADASNDPYDGSNDVTPTLDNVWWQMPMEAGGRFTRVEVKSVLDMPAKAMIMNVATFSVPGSLASPDTLDKITSTIFIKEEGMKYAVYGDEDNFGASFAELIYVSLKTSI